MKKNAIILSIFVLSACTTAGRNFPTNRNLELTVTDHDRVKSIYGNPYRITEDVSKDLKTEIYHYYYYDNGTNNHKALSVEFLGDRVHGYIFSLNWPGESTDFDLNKKSAVIPGRTTTKEVVETFGEPAGMMKLPTHLFGLESQILMQKKGARTCIRYEYAHMNSGKGSGIVYTKYITFYVDQADKIIDFVVTNNFP